VRSGEDTGHHMFRLCFNVLTHDGKGSADTTGCVPVCLCVMIIVTIRLNGSRQGRT